MYKAYKDMMNKKPQQEQKLIVTQENFVLEYQ